MQFRESSIAMFTRVLSKPKALYVYEFITFFLGGRGVQWIMVWGCCDCAYAQGWEDHHFLALDAVHFIYFQIPSISGS